MTKSSACAADQRRAPTNGRKRGFAAKKKQHETEEKTGNSVQKKKTLEVKKRVFSIVSCERNTEIPLREEKRNKRN